MQMLSDVARALTLRADAVLVLKVTLVFALCFASLALADKTKASVRHLIVLATFAVVLLMPVGAVLFPAVQIALPSAPQRYAEVSTLAQPTISTKTVYTALLAAWLIGALVLVAFLLVDLMRLRRMRRSALPW